MKKFLSVGFILFAVSLLSACDRFQRDTNKQLLFVEFEQGVEPYQTRLIVTPEYMRFDDGEGSVDFILYDRKKNVIYSVNSGERTVMAVEPQQVEIKPPFELKLEEKNLGTMKEAPAIEGKKPIHYQFSANGEICYDVVAVKGLMPDVVAAMKGFSDILASDSAVTFSSIPADMLNACDMSMSTFAAGRHFKHGFPIQEWSARGSGRTLVDYNDDFEVEPSLFVLPEQFKHYSIQDYREGKVQIGD